MLIRIKSNKVNKSLLFQLSDQRSSILLQLTMTIHLFIRKYIFISRKLLLVME
jgi:hypothetical protein